MKDSLIQITHPDILKYKSGSKSSEVDVGYDPIKRIIHVYASDSAEFYKMTEEEKNKMVNNIKEAVKLLEGNFVVI